MDDGRCVTDGQGEYGAGESCRVKALRPLVLTTVQYEVERGYDFVSVDGTAFRGESGPSEVKMDTDSELVWSSVKLLGLEALCILLSIYLEIKLTTHQLIKTSLSRKLLQFVLG